MIRLGLLMILILNLISCSNNDHPVSSEDATNINDKQDNIEQYESKAESTETAVPIEEEKEELVEPEYILNDATWYLEPIDDTIDDNVVLMTIDDAPDKYSLKMAKLLKELNVPAIFFVNGHFLETDEQKEQLKQIHELGFAIGNHTYSHKSLPELSEADQQEEIIKVNDQVESIIDQKPLFFRAPFGQNTDYSKGIIEDESMLSMNWSYGYDWNEQYMEKDALANIMVNADELRAGANLLMHDREWTYEALEDIVLGLRDKGYGFIDPNTIQLND